MDNKRLENNRGVKGEYAAWSVVMYTHSLSSCASSQMTSLPSAEVSNRWLAANLGLLSRGSVAEETVRERQAH